MSDILISQQMPILALRGLTVFPEMVVHFDIGREKSILAMEAAMNEEQTISAWAKARLVFRTRALTLR